jgi:hypothetical protein
MNAIPPTARIKIMRRCRRGQATMHISNATADVRYAVREDEAMIAAAMSSAGLHRTIKALWLK